MTVARGIAGAAVVLAALVVGALLLGFGTSHTYQLVFENAGQLVKGNDVQVGGRRVGSVTSIDLTDDNQALITITVSSEFAPLHAGTTAALRSESLSGIANRVISLSLGPNSAPTLADNAKIGTDKTTSIVDIDQIFNTLDARTRRGLRQVVEGFAVQYGGREKQANLAARRLNPAISSVANLANELDRDSGAFAALLTQTARVSNALAERKGDLTNLVTNTNTTMAALGDERAALANDLQLLPPTLRRADSTFVDLRSTLDDLDTLVNASKPATRRLKPFLQILRPLARRAVPTVHDLRLAIHAPGDANDLIDVMQRLPKLGAQAATILPRARETFRHSQSTLEFYRPYVPDLAQWLRDFGDGAANYDANGHYARIQPIFNAFNVPELNGTSAPLLNPDSPLLSAGQRLLGAESGVEARCPGAASQIRPDKSNVFTPSGPDDNSDCDRNDVLPGP